MPRGARVSPSYLHFLSRAVRIFRRLLRLLSLIYTTCCLLCASCSLSPSGSRLESDRDKEKQRGRTHCGSSSNLAVINTRFSGRFVTRVPARVLHDKTQRDKTRDQDAARRAATPRTFPDAPNYLLHQMLHAIFLRTFGELIARKNRKS